MAEEQEVVTQEIEEVAPEGGAASKKNSKAAKAGKSATYVIGCKLPCGLKIGHGSETVTLKGANDSMLINGFGITKDVPAAAWEQFEKNHKGSKMFLNGIVFAVSDMKSVEDASLERAKQKTGLEQADPSSSGVEPDKED